MRDNFEATKKMRKGEKTRPRCEERATDGRRALVRLKRSWIVMNEGQLRRACKKNRLAAGHMKKLMPVTVPTENDPEKTETAYLMMNPAKPHRTLNLVYERVASCTTDLIPSGEHTWVGQGKRTAFDNFRQQAKDTDIADALVKMIKKNPKSLEEWVAGVNGNARGGSSSSEGSDSDGGSNDAETDGEESAKPPTKKAKKDSPASSRKRPPVPMFAETGVKSPLKQDGLELRRANSSGSLRSDLLTISAWSCPTTRMTTRPAMVLHR